jgi:glycosyltransferase involved in cell wall biosynthesis
MPPRLLYIDPHPVPDESPESLQILQTVDGLGQAGAEVVLVTPRPRRDATPAAYLGRNLSPRVRLDYLADYRNAWWFPSNSNRLFYRGAARIAGGSDADALLVRNLKLADALLDLPRRPPLVFETHEIFAQSHREAHPRRGWRQRRKLAALVQREGRVYRGADRLLALTAALAHDIRQTYADAGAAAVVPDAVDLELARRALAEPHAGAAQPPTLLYLGSLHPWKGVDSLVRMMALLPQARLRIVGGGAARIAELQRLAAACGVSDRVQLPGAVAPLERFRAIRPAAVCILPLTPTSIGSRYTSPLKLFEYMAMGKPIVASDVPALREVLRDGEHALLVPPGDIEALAQAVRRLLADAALAQALGRAAAALAQRYSWQARADRILAALDRRPNDHGQTD